MSDPPGLISRHSCPTRHSMEQQEVEKKEVLQDTVDECVLTPSTLQEGSESDQSYSDGEFPLDEQEFGSALDLACECSHTQGDETLCGPPGNVHVVCSAYFVYTEEGHLYTQALQTHIALNQDIMDLETQTSGGSGSLQPSQAGAVPLPPWPPGQAIAPMSGATNSTHLSRTSTKCCQIPSLDQMSFVPCNDTFSLGSISLEVLDLSNVVGSHACITGKVLSLVSLLSVPGTIFSMLVQLSQVVICKQLYHYLVCMFL